jgi:hypothetical protein
VNKIVGLRTPVSGMVLLGMIEGIIPHVQEFSQNDINGNVITQIFNHVVEHLLR